MNTSEYKVTGMTCEHCKSAIRAEVSQISRVQQINVSAAQGSLSVTTDGPTEADAIIAAVDEAGHQAVRH